ncbi:hypothetical protein RJ640_011441 [Escallonia rubra]|uniref:CRC domain-containing protein n=1 Tax=Escallonia rubra TaxID=112253 RepID=A0AA88R778_9ASTE|nr:hypothetical protein RJ640_011441 [Escallonia rubra]
MGEEERVKLERESEGESEITSRVVVVASMDTPKRNQISTPISKFEDSPVFNYINNLSPIQPVKSMHSSQSFNSLSFASLPSVFTSPHVSSLKESRFLRRHQFSDMSKPDFSSENGNKVGRDEGVMDVAHDLTQQPENFDPRSSIGDASDERSYESSKLEIELSHTLSYDYVNPDCNPSTSCGIENECASEKGSFGSEMRIEGISQIDQNREATGCDWESLISDAADLLIFDSPNETGPAKGSNQKSFDSVTGFCTSLNIDLPKTQASGAVGSSEQPETENICTQPGEAGDLGDRAENHDMFASTSLDNCMAGDLHGKMGDEVRIYSSVRIASNLQRGTRRRCLVFEMAGARRKRFDDGSSCGSSALQQSHKDVASNDKHIAPLKPGNDSSRCILPGIGLHLNALATTSMDYKVIKLDDLGLGGQLIERDMVSAENEISVVEDASQASGYAGNEEYSQSSPKKKRRRSENGGESEACKRCNCKKSKCLKLYCECFAAGVYCVEPCSCQECFNKPIHEDTVLSTRKQIESRNPLAFAPKVIRSSDSVLEIGDDSSKTPASARHKRGCNCKKSGCLKKYCECYQGGVGCSINCRCEGCKNAFGRKDGTELAELEEEELGDERSLVDRASQKTLIHNVADHNADLILPATPLRFGRSLIQLPFSSKSRPPRSSVLAIGSSSGTSQKFGKPDVGQRQAKFEKRFEPAKEDEMPEFLQGSGSPISGIKSGSPNSKRVSPPHCNTGTSPGQRSSRKLILQSIPSFPSLTPKH